MVNLRNTKQRQLVLDTVKNRCDHPTADQIYLDVRTSNDRISRGTVYRNLNLLVDTGELLHVKVPGTDRFDGRTEYHYHILCTECKAVCDAPAEYDSALDKSLSLSSGFAIVRHRTVFEGLCPNCQAMTNRQRIG